MFYWRSAWAPAGGEAVEWGFTAADRASDRDGSQRDGSDPDGSERDVSDRASETDATGDDFGEFNLGGHVGDDPGVVEANRRALAAEVGVPREHLLFMAQCHGADVMAVDEPWRGDPPAVDGIVTTNPQLALAVLVADCVPVLLADPAAGVVGAVHAGRPGMLAGIVPAALEVMAQAGARDIHAAVGPSVCGRCYEVPAAMRDEAARVSPPSVAVSWTGTPAIDVATGVVDQLIAGGVNITWVPGCTRESHRLYSYRRRSRTGRFAGVVRGGRR